MTFEEQINQQIDPIFQGPMGIPILKPDHGAMVTPNPVLKPRDTNCNVNQSNCINNFPILPTGQGFGLMNLPAKYK